MVSSTRHRFDLKMTAVECCMIIGINKSTLVDWEGGRHEPNHENRQKIAKFLKTESSRRNQTRRASRGPVAILARRV
jgi:DNA-binding XRE family transcriptional regulator